MFTNRWSRSISVVLVAIVSGLLVCSALSGCGESDCALGTSALALVAIKLDHGEDKNALISSGFATAACVKIAEEERRELGE